MAERRSALVRAVEFFETADIREAKAAFSLVKEVMQERTEDKPKRIYTRKSTPEVQASTPHRKHGGEPADRSNSGEATLGL